MDCLALKKLAFTSKIYVSQMTHFPDLNVFNRVRSQCLGPVGLNRILGYYKQTFFFYVGLKGVNLINFNPKVKTMTFLLVFNIYFLSGEK